MTETRAGAALPVVPTEFDLDLPSDLPFYYGSLSHLGIDYLVEPTEALRLLLKTNGKHLEPALFDGKACVSCNYQLYLGQFSRGASIMQVIEFNIVAYPAADAGRAPTLTYPQYAAGEDQTGSYGFCRIHVACDSDLWIKAGQEAFGEPKFKTGFDIIIPAVNRNPGPPPHWTSTWAITCKKDGPQGPPIVTIQANLTGLPAHPASIAPFTEYGYQKDGKPLAAPLNVFQPYQLYDLSTNGAQGRVTITPGPAVEPVGDFIHLIDGETPAGAWVYQSPPVAVQNRPYFVNVQ
ncbi:MAG: hypothetical protein ACRDSH_02110 [Pseudonocardiaceae bacterium]